MKLTINRAEFLKALKAARTNLIRARMPLPILGGALIEGGNRPGIVVTDLERTRRIPISPVAISGTNGWLPLKTTIDVVTKMKDRTLTITFDEKAHTVQIGAVVINGEDAEDWPALQFDESKSKVYEFSKAGAEEFVMAFSNVMIAASKDDARPILTGVNIDSQAGRMVVTATDSYRLMTWDTSIPWTEERSILLPAKYALDLKTIGYPTQLRYNTKEVVTQGRGGLLMTRIIEGTFPNWRQLMPSDEAAEHGIYGPVEELVAALEVMKPIATDNIPVKVAVDGDGVKISVSRQDVGEAVEVLPNFEATTDEYLAAFNLHYLLSGIKPFSGEVAILAADPLKPHLIVGDKPELLTYLLMPVRL